MVMQKSEPTFGGLRVHGRSAHPAGNGSLGDVETQRQELTVNTRCAPGRIFRHHPEDQIPNFLGNSSSANDPAGSGNGLPIECESRPVPTHNSLGAYDNQRLLPSGPESPHEDPKELIECCQSWSGMSALQYCELLAKGEVFQKQPTMSVEEAPDRSRQEPNGVYHVPVLSHSAYEWQRRMRLKSQADRILANDRTQNTEHHPKNPGHRAHQDQRSTLVTDDFKESRSFVFCVTQAHPLQ
jgi:hypothetical protein